MNKRFFGHTIVGDERMTIDRMARGLLRGKWKSAIAAQLLWAVTAVIWLLTEWGVGHWFGSMAQAIGGLLLLAADLWGLSPLKYAIAAFYWRSIYRKDITLRDCLREGYGRQYKRAVGWRCRYWFRSLGMALVCFCPAALLLGSIGAVDTYVGTVSAGAAVFYRLLTALSVPMGFIAYKISMLAYLPSLYLVISGMEMGQVFSWARKLMRGSGDRTVWFFLGFGWWMLLYVLIVPWLFVSPILESAKAGLVYRRLLKTKKQASAIRMPDTAH